jgi:hypothetical protein
MSDVDDDGNKYTTSFDHPTLDESSIYFMVDVPHLLKTIRNNIFIVKTVQVFDVLFGSLIYHFLAILVKIYSKSFLF